MKGFYRKDQIYWVLPFNMGFRIWKRLRFWQLGYNKQRGGAGRKSFHLGPFCLYWG